MHKNINIFISETDEWNASLMSYFFLSSNKILELWTT